MKKFEAKSKTRDGYIHNIFGIKISSSRYDRVLKDIVQVCQEKRIFKAIFVITANSEFFLEAAKDRDFFDTMKSANLIVPDGISVTAAIEYKKRKGQSQIRNLFQGLQVGKEILSGKLSDSTVPGYKLVKDLLEQADKSKLRIFMLGGKKESAEYVLNRFKGDIASYQEEPVFDKEMKIGDKATLAMINEFRPDVLLVAFGHFKAEKWIAKHLPEIKAKVVMGVGSSFDEIAGSGIWKSQVPEWATKAGLKWLWRLGRHPSHITRVWNAVPVFAWKMYKEK